MGLTALEEAYLHRAGLGVEIDLKSISLGDLPENPQRRSRTPSNRAFVGASHPSFRRSVGLWEDRRTAPR